MVIRNQENVTVTVYAFGKYQIHLTCSAIYTYLARLFSYETLMDENLSISSLKVKVSTLLYE